MRREVTGTRTVFAKTLQDRTHDAAEISTALREKALPTPGRLLDREATELEIMLFCERSVPNIKIFV